MDDTGKRQSRKICGSYQIETRLYRLLLLSLQPFSKNCRLKS